jgi:DNA-binding MarR family transcriptional regulator
MSTKLTASEVYATCVCLGVQRAARGVARRYDEALRPVGITSGQFTILSSLLRDNPTPIGSLAELLGLDRTTLNRNLRPLEADKLITTVADPNDARVRRIQLTLAGRNKLDEAIPLWRKVQSQSNGRLGKTGWQNLRPLLAHLS